MPYVRYSGIRKIFACGIRNTAQGTRNPTNDCNLEDFPVPLIRNPKSTAWNPESKTVLDSLIWGNFCLYSYKGGSYNNKILLQEFNLSNYTDPRVANANLGGTDEQLRVKCFK